MGENLKNLSELVTNKKIAVVVAHPDDELFYFSNLLIRYGPQCRIFCVTDANFDHNGNDRLERMNKISLQLTGQAVLTCGLKDSPSIDLNLSEISSKLLENRLNEFDIVFTHSPHGDYGHYNHRDVYFATTMAMQKKQVFFPAEYVFPDYQLTIDENEYELKLKMIEDQYLSEFRVFWKLGRLNSTENYASCGEVECSELRRFLVDGERPDPEKLEKYRFFWKVLVSQKGLPNF